MEKLSFKLFKLIVLEIVLTLIVLGHGYSINARWVLGQPNTRHESSHLCSDIIRVTRKLLENGLIRDVIYPKVTEDGMFVKSTKVVETASPSSRNIVHFPSKQLDTESNQQRPYPQPFYHNRSENSRFKRHHGHHIQIYHPFQQQPLEPESDQDQKSFQQHFAKIGPLSGQTINFVPLNVPFGETDSIDLNNRQPQAYLIDLSSLSQPAQSPDDHPVDLRPMSPRFYRKRSQPNRLKRRQDDGKEEEEQAETESSPIEPNVVKKTFGYKVTLYKSPNVQEPQIMTEEFFGDGKKKNVIKILKKDRKPPEVNLRPEQLSQQSSSSNGRYIPQYVTAPVGTMSQDDEDELEANRKLLGNVRKQLADEKGIEATRTLSKSGDEKQHDKKGAKEKALREKTQIEFFEREKIFDDRYGRKVEEQPQTNQDRFLMQGRPEIVRLTTPAPDPPSRQQVTIVSPEDTDGVPNTGLDYQSLHDLLLKRLKGWREKGYKITTELEIVQRGAVHDKARSVRQRGRGEQTFQRYESGANLIEKSPPSQLSNPYNDPGQIGQIEPLSVTHVAPDKKLRQMMKTNGNINNDPVNNNNEQDDNNSGNLFSSLPKFLMDPGDYDSPPDGHKVTPVIELVTPQDPHQQIHLQQAPPTQHPAHHLTHLTHHPQVHHQLPIFLAPPPLPEAMKLVQTGSPPANKSKVMPNNNGTNVGQKPMVVQKGRKYSFKGMTRKIPESSDSGRRFEPVIDTNTNDGIDRKVHFHKSDDITKTVTPTISVSLATDKTNPTVTSNRGKGKTSKNKVKDGQSSRRLAAQKKLKARAKQKARLRQQQQQLQQPPQQYQQYPDQVIQKPKQLQQQFQPNPQDGLLKTNGHMFRPPMSIQDQIIFPASPLISNSVRNRHKDHIPSSPHHPEVDLTNPLSFLDGVHESLYMPENGFDDISFGNPTLISLPGLINSPDNDPDSPVADHLRFLSNQGANRNPSVNLEGGGKQNFVSFPEPEKKQRPGSLSFEDPSPVRQPSPPHTEILIGKSVGPPPNQPNSLTSLGQQYDSHTNGNNKIRDYPTSIQDITRGQKVSQGYNLEPGFGRESPDNLLLPGKEVNPILNQYKDNFFTNMKLANKWNDKKSNEGHTNNQRSPPTPTVNSWLQHGNGNVNLLSSPKTTMIWNQNSRGQYPQTQGISNIDHQQSPLVNGLMERNRGTTYSTEKPVKLKQGFVFDEQLELISDVTKDYKPGHYQGSTWTEPEMGQVRGSMRNTGQRKKSKIKVKNQVPGQFGDHQITEDIFSIGFDSQRVRTPKSNDLISHSSQIYPLIGGYSPFIIPMTSGNLDYEPQMDSQMEMVTTDNEDYLDLQNPNQAQLDDDIVGDEGRRKRDDDVDDDDDDGDDINKEKEDSDQVSMVKMSKNNDDGDEKLSSSSIPTADTLKDEFNQQKGTINNDLRPLIEGKINGEKSNYENNTETTLIGTEPTIQGKTEKPKLSQIWSQPCPTCPEL